jgi:transposase
VKKHTSVTAGTTIGLDVSDEYIQICVLDEAGEIIEEGRLRTTQAAVRKRFSSLEGVRIALEVGTHSPWISRILQELGHEVFVANPRKLRAIYENERKSDRVDARWLARVARLDPHLLSPIEHRGPQAQADLAIVRARQALVAARTQLVNHVRGAVKAFGSRLPKTTTHGFPKKVVGSLPDPLESSLVPILGVIDELTAKIHAYEKQIERLCQERYPQTGALRQVAGVGPVTSLTYVLTLEDPWRFKKSRAVGCYLGLTCQQNQSGDQDPELGITRAGDRDLRYLLVQAAHYILGPFGPDTDLRRWGMALAARGGKNAKKRAVVAVARKLAVLLHRLWVTAEVYEPLRHASRRTLKQSA